ncbi:MAG: hypothetical protein IPL96_02170 [Holophagaceae bacterium]|nr:hypothetical protein [Holophagaceae bacterium]
MHANHLTTPRSPRTSSPGLPLPLRLRLAIAEGAPWFARAIAVKPKEEKVYMEIARAFAETQSVI